MKAFINMAKKGFQTFYVVRTINVVTSTVPNVAI